MWTLKGEPKSETDQVCVSRRGKCMYHSKSVRNNYYFTQILCQLGFFLSARNRKHSGNKSKKHLLKGYWEITVLPGFKKQVSNYASSTWVHMTPDTCSEDLPAPEPSLHCLTHHQILSLALLLVLSSAAVIDSWSSVSLLSIQNSEMGTGWA